MRTNNLIYYDDSIFRVLEIQNERILIIDCIKRTMPKWIEKQRGLNTCTEDDLISETNIYPLDIEELCQADRKCAYRRYTMISGVVPFVGNEIERSIMIGHAAEQFNVSKQTIRNYLCLYLSYQTVSVLAPKKSVCERPLTVDEKNMRWALNKFFYNKHKNSIQTAYELMLKERYCDHNGKLLEHYPTIHQFRYFYRKHKKMQTYYISRDGIKNYQRNNRPLVGDGVHAFAPAVGVGMLDATVCDIYLVNETGDLIGRPILTACVDAYSGLCCGYCLSWEGGVYSLKLLMSNIISNKAAWCKRFGISIDTADWDCSGAIPGMLITDMGREYKSYNFEQIAELGVTVMNLPAYRPELKGAVEKFFDVIQNLYIPHLRGKGVIEPDYQERGAHDYRKDACLTMSQFEKIILRCIVHYNSQRIVSNFPYTEDMIDAGVRPCSSDIWNWSKKQSGANLIPVTQEQLELVLLPRTNGKFSRSGLHVNNLHYHCDGYTEKYLRGDSAVVAYSADDVSTVWLIEKGRYIEFKLIESRFQDKSLDRVQTLRNNQKRIIRSEYPNNLQSKISLADHINTIANNPTHRDAVNMKNIKETRRKEQRKQRNRKDGTQ